MRKNSLNLDLYSNPIINNNVYNKASNIISTNITSNNLQSNNKSNNVNYIPHFLKNEHNLLRKRHRLNSFEAFFNGFERDNLGYNHQTHKRSIDENDIFNSFCKETKNDFQEEDLENLDDFLNSKYLFLFIVYFDC